MRGKNRGKTRHNKSEDAESSAQAVDRRPRFLVTDQELLILYPKVGTDLAFFPFADTIEPKAAANALNGSYHPFIKAPMRFMCSQCYTLSCHHRRQSPICSRDLPNLQRFGYVLDQATIHRCFLPPVVYLDV